MSTMAASLFHWRQSPASWRFASRESLFIIERNLRHLATSIMQIGRWRGQLGANRYWALAAFGLSEAGGLCSCKDFDADGGRVLRR